MRLRPALLLIAAASSLIARSTPAWADTSSRPLAISLKSHAGKPVVGASVEIRIVTDDDAEEPREKTFPLGESTDVPGAYGTTKLRDPYRTGQKGLKLQVKYSKGESVWTDVDRKSWNGWGYVVTVDEPLTRFDLERRPRRSYTMHQYRDPVTCCCVTVLLPDWVCEDVVVYKEPQLVSLSEVDVSALAELGPKRTRSEYRVRFLTPKVTRSVVPSTTNSAASIAAR